MKWLSGFFIPQKPVISYNRAIERDFPKNSNTYDVFKTTAGFLSSQGLTLGLRLSGALVKAIIAWRFSLANVSINFCGSSLRIS